MQDPAGRGTPGGDHRATEHGQVQDQREQHERLEEIARGLHAEQEPAPAVFSGRGLVKGKVSNRGRGLGDGRLAERIGLKAVAAGELDEVDQMASSSGNASSTRRAVAARLRRPRCWRTRSAATAARLKTAQTANKLTSARWGSLSRASTSTNSTSVASETAAARMAPLQSENVHHWSQVFRSRAVTTSAWGDMIGVS